MRYVKLFCALLFLSVALSLMIASGAALVMSQWAVLFGAVNGEQIKTGFLLIFGGLLAGAALHFAAIKLLASEPEFGWGWSIAAILPVLILAFHFGMLLLGLFMAGGMMFQVRKQVRIARERSEKQPAIPSDG
jgi:hypothetical protein